MRELKMKNLITCIILVLILVACCPSSDVAGTDVSSLEPTSTPPPTTAVNKPESPEEEPTETPQPEPAATLEKELAVNVLDVNWYTSSIDHFHFIGLVENSGNVDLEYVMPVLILRDTEGKLVATDYSYTALDVLLVGDIAPFKITFIEAVPEWSEYEITIEADEVFFFNAYRDLEVVSADGKVPEFGAYEIVGEVVNTGDSDAEFVEVIAILYGADGKLLGTDSIYTTLYTVVAGGTSPFTILFLQIAEGTVDHFDLLIEGNVVE
jgi:hypothetical protein